MKKTLWTLITAAALAAAQEKPAPEIVSKMIPVHHVNTNHLQSLLTIPGVSVRGDEGMHVLVVTGRPDAVSTLEEMVKKLDVAPAPPPARPNIELTVYMIAGAAEAKRAEDVPKELSSTVKQLHQLFPYKNYRVLDSFVLRGRDGETAGETSGVFPNATSGLPPVNYTFRYRNAVVADGNPRTIRLNGLRMGLRAAYPSTGGEAGKPNYTYSDSGINTDIDIREGQKVVVGKSSYGAEDAFILVVTAKIIE